MNGIFIIVGLGNPGKKFENTRHNVGFETIDLISRKLNIKVSKLKFKALIGEGYIGENRIILVKPQTYMNLSGESVREIFQWYKIPESNLILVYDDMDIPLGRVRIRPKGSSGTHNGMKSVIYQLQSDEFPRVRIGIDMPPQGFDMVNYVIGRFSKEERTIIDRSIMLAADAVEEIVISDVDKAMNKYNCTQE